MVSVLMKKTIGHDLSSSMTFHIAESGTEERIKNFFGDTGEPAPYLFHFKLQIQGNNFGGGNSHFDVYVSTRRIYSLPSGMFSQIAANKNRLEDFLYSYVWVEEVYVVEKIKRRSVEFNSSPLKYEKDENNIYCLYPFSILE